jgi:ubiquinone/menaquinone biosynthesis C-methylase UbiE
VESSVYEAEYHHEMTHWWYRERRRLFRRLIQSYLIPSHAKCADVGTSTGTNLTLFSDLNVGQAIGLEYEFEAIQLAIKKNTYSIVQGSAEKMPFVDGEFDLVTCTDVLEHVSDDVSALSEINRILRPGGYALITVPAFKILWGHQDVISHHIRRYRLAELEQKIESSGFVVIESFYFNWIMFVPVLIIRILSRIVRSRIRSEGDINSPLINKALSLVFRVDCLLSRYLRFPFGVSALVLAKVPSDLHQEAD